MADKVDPRTGELVTTNYGWTKPTVGASTDAWGGYINADLDGIDTTVKSVSTVANAAYPASNPAGYITASAIPAPYVLPTASTSVLGGVKVDGTTVSISGGGVISAAGAVAVSATAPSSPVAGSLWFDTTGGQMYVWYNDGNSSQWVPVVNQGYVAAQTSQLVLPPVAANWTHRNFGTDTTLTDVTNGVRIYDDSAVAVNHIMRGATIASPSTPYNVDILLSTLGYAGNISSDVTAGVGWTDGTKIQFIFTDFSVTTAPAAYEAIQINNMSNFTTKASAAFGPIYGMFNQAQTWFRLGDNGTNVTFSISQDGISWLQIYTVAKASGYLGASGYSNIGFWINPGLLASGGLIQTVLQSWRVH